MIIPPTIHASNPFLSMRSLHSSHPSHTPLHRLPDPPPSTKLIHTSPNLSTSVLFSFHRSATSSGRLHHLKVLGQQEVAFGTPGSVPVCVIHKMGDASLPLAGWWDTPHYLSTGWETPLSIIHKMENASVFLINRMRHITLFLIHRMGDTSVLQQWKQIGFQAAPDIIVALHWWSEGVDTKSISNPWGRYLSPRCVGRYWGGDTKSIMNASGRYPLPRCVGSTSFRFPTVKAKYSRTDSRLGADSLLNRTQPKVSPFSFSLSPVFYRSMKGAKKKKSFQSFTITLIN